MWAKVIFNGYLLLQTIEYNKLDICITPQIVLGTFLKKMYHIYNDIKIYPDEDSISERIDDGKAFSCLYEMSTNSTEPL